MCQEQSVNWKHSLTERRSSVLWGTALTYSYISSAHLVNTSVFCANSSKLANKSSSSGSRIVPFIPHRRSGCRNGDCCCFSLDALSPIRSGKYEYAEANRPGLGLGVPNNFFDAMLSARVKALPREGELESGRACGFGGGGKVGCVEGPAIGDPASSEFRLSAVGVLSLRSEVDRLRAAVISKQVD